MEGILLHLVVLLIILAVVVGIVRLAQQAGLLPGWMGQAAMLVIGAVFLIMLIYTLVPLMHSSVP